VGKALEIERDLAAADDPYNSTWRETYCRFRCEAIEDDCPVDDRDFYYKIRPMCRNTQYDYCWLQHPARG
jgi:hypothetical protein